MYRILLIFLIIGFFLPTNIVAQKPTVPHSIYEWKKYDNLKLAGWSEKRLKKVERKLKEKCSGAFMVIHKGKAVITWGNYERRFMCNAIKKTLLSCLSGVYAEDGILTTTEVLEDDSLMINGQKGAQMGMAPQKNIGGMLTVHPGIAYKVASKNTLFPIIKYKTPRPYSTRKPPKKDKFGFDYNTEVNELATLIRGQVKKDIFKAFYDELAYGLRMEDFRITDGYFVKNQDTAQTQANPDFYFRLSARDLARIGQLYLQEGKWRIFNHKIYNPKTKQMGMWIKEPILPDYWVTKSLEPYGSNIPKMPDHVGYGYHWWVNMFTDSTENYSSIGRGGQLLAIFPKHQIVIVHLSNTYKSKGVSFRRLHKLVSGVFKAKADSIWHKPPETFLGDVLGDKPNIIRVKGGINQYKGTYKVVHVEEEEMALKLEKKEDTKEEKDPSSEVPSDDTAISAELKSSSEPEPEAEELWINITIKNNSLLMETSWMGKFYLLPIGKDIFLWEDARYQMSFIRGKGDKIDYVRIEGTE